MDNPNEQISIEEQAVDGIVYRMTGRNNRAAASTEEDALVFRRAIVSRILKGPKPTVNYNILSFVKECHRCKDYGELFSGLTLLCERAEESLFHARLQDHMCDCQGILLNSSVNPEEHNVTFVKHLMTILQACNITRESIPESERLTKSNKAIVFQGDAIKLFHGEINRWIKNIWHIQSASYLKEIKRIKRKNKRLIESAEKDIINSVEDFQRASLISEMRDISAVFNGVISLTGVTEKTCLSKLADHLDWCERKYQSDILQGQLRRVEVLRNLTLDRLHIFCGDSACS